MEWKPDIKSVMDKFNEKKTPLEYEQYKKYYAGTRQEGQQWIFKFENNYGASVVKHYGSYGFEDDLFELAVLYFDGEDYHLTYNTPITNGVIGYLTNEDVIKYLEKIKNLGEKYDKD